MCGMKSCFNLCRMMCIIVYNRNPCNFSFILETAVGSAEGGKAFVDGVFRQLQFIGKQMRLADPGPLRAPRAHELLPPGGRAAYVAVPLRDAENRPVPGRWRVLDRRRWVCLGGHGTRRRTEALVARLNGLAHRPAWSP